MVKIKNNDYERAFDAWLREMHIPCHIMDQSCRREFYYDKIKSFDFAICPAGGKLTLIDVKGRLFRGQSLVGLKGLQCWVTREDIHGMEEWRDIVAVKQPADAAFVFAYRLAQVDVETDGLSVFGFEGAAYVFFIIRLDDYRRAMKQRSPRWRTVYLTAKDFRRLACPLEEWIEKLNLEVVNG
ncbi:MAG: hypothetical protein FJ263_10120 [Planctomycetes bacterium]|nr:hypothetical protein [Planctomycetota bacterium]